MYCPKCQTQNEEGAQFCKNCGFNLRYAQQIQKPEKDLGGFLLTFIFLTFIIELPNLAIFNGWYVPPVIIVYVIWIAQAASLILLSLTCKNPIHKSIGIIIALIIIAVRIYKIVTYSTYAYSVFFVF